MAEERRYGTAARFWLGFLLGFAIAVVIFGVLITIY
jgi:hypothetical protein